MWHSHDIISVVDGSGSHQEEHIGLHGDTWEMRNAHEDIGVSWNGGTPKTPQNDHF